LFDGIYRCGANAPVRVWTCGEPIRLTTHLRGVTAQVEVGPFGGPVADAPANTMWLASTKTPDSRRELGLTDGNHLIARDEHALYIADAAGSKHAADFLATVDAISQCKVAWAGDSFGTTKTP